LLGKTSGVATPARAQKQPNLDTLENALQCRFQRGFYDVYWRFDGEKQDVVFCFTKAVLYR
jgi:hypothetical protein